MATEEATEPESRRPGRGRIIGFIVVVALIVLLASLRGIFGLYTDYLWYDDIGRTDEWTSVLTAQIVLSVIFIAVFFVLAWLNLVIADRIAPALRPPGPEEELLMRWHESIGRRTGLVRFAIAGFFALVAGGGAASQWNEWILFTNPVDFGTTEPVFGRDVAFYVFRLPFLNFVVSWFFAAFIIIGIITAIWHYINGGIRIQTVDRRSTPQVKAHLSIILAFLALFKAADYYLQRFDLLTSQQGFARGAFYTDLNASLPAIQLLLLISLFSVGLLVANIWRRGWALPSIAVGLWALIAVIAGGIYPAVIQQLQVAPDQEARERPYIERNIAGTRDAFSLDDVTTGDFVYTGVVEPRELLQHRNVLSNARLLDPRIVDDSFTLNQKDRDFYRDFDEALDVDRYTIDGRLTPMIVGVRELGQVNAGSWEELHAVNTHGYGIVMAPANEVDENGVPQFVVRDAPLESDIDEIQIDQPQIYFGEADSPYAVVQTTQREFEPGNAGGFSYDGEGGVPMSSFLQRLAFSFRFGEIEPLISGTLTDETEVLFVRDVVDRARRIAPFLTYDSNPYAVVSDGGVSWVIDAYTVSSEYPYSNLAPTTQLPDSSDLNRSFNYVRNSVKVVVDAYDGSVEFYAVNAPDDPGADPILRAYQQQFDGLFRSMDEMPADIRNHLRFPEDLFRVQTELWGRYQLEDVSEFFTANLAWEVAANTDSVSGGQEVFILDANDATQVIGRTGRRVDPFYQVLQLPDEDEPSFVVSRSYVPRSLNDGIREITAYIVGRVDDRGNTELRQYLMTAGANVEVDGPSNIHELLSIDPVISEEQTQLSQAGSEFLAGNLLPLLIDDAIIYVRPYYVRPEPESDTSNQTTEPAIQFVAVVVEDTIGFAPTYAEALAALFDITVAEAAAITGTAVPTGVDADRPPSGVIGPDSPDAVQRRLADILARLNAAEEALPDFAEYERLQEEALDDLEQLLRDLEAGEVPEVLGEEEPEESANA
jgi:uncharacterized membrane protein (UPF0182 family)